MKTKVTIIAIVTILAVISGRWVAEHDKETQQAYEAYEACFEREFKMSPSVWYATYGELPECKN